MQCCDPEAVLFSLEFSNPNDDPLTPIDGAPLSAYFDAMTVDEMSHALPTAFDLCKDPRLEFVAGIIHTVD